MKINHLKRRIAAVGAAAILVTSGAALATAPAQASVSKVSVASAVPAHADQPIDDLESTSGNSKLHTTIHWDSSTSYHILGSESYTRDQAADGRGPYAHFSSVNPNFPSGYQQIATHNTDGNGATRYFGNAFASLDGNLAFVNVTVCDGGNYSGGSAANCYGRRYYNPYVSYQYSIPYTSIAPTGNGLIY